MTRPGFRDRLRRTINRDPRCAFCGAGPDSGRRFVSGPGLYICDACVRHAMRVLDEDAPPESTAAPDPPAT